MYCRPTGRATDVFGCPRREAGQEGAAIVAPLDESVDGVAVGGDGRDAHFAVLVAQGLRLAHAARAAAGGLAPGRFGIVHPQRDIAHAVAVQADVLGDGMIGRERRGEHQADLVLHQHVGSAVARAGLRAAIGRQAEAERGAVEVRGLARVAHVELDVIGAVERQEILLNRRGMLQMFAA